MTAVVDSAAVNDILNHLFDPQLRRSRASVKTLISPNVVLDFPLLPPAPASPATLPQVSSTTSTTILPSFRHSPAAQALSLFRLPNLLLGYLFGHDAVSFEIDQLVEIDSSREDVVIWEAHISWVLHADNVSNITTMIPGLSRFVTIERDRIDRRRIKLLFQRVESDFSGLTSSDLVLTRLTYDGPGDFAEQIERFPFGRYATKYSPYINELLLSPIYGLLLLAGLGHSTRSLAPSSQRRRRAPLPAPSPKGKGKQQLPEVDEAKSSTALSSPQQLTSHSYSDFEEGSESAWSADALESRYHKAARLGHKMLRDSGSQARNVVFLARQTSQDAGQVGFVINQSVVLLSIALQQLLAFGLWTISYILSGAFLRVRPSSRNDAFKDASSDSELDQMEKEARARTIFGRSAISPLPPILSTGATSPLALKRVSFAEGSATPTLQTSLSSFMRQHPVSRQAPEPPTASFSGSLVYPPLDMDDDEDERLAYSSPLGPVLPGTPIRRRETGTFTSEDHIAHPAPIHLSDFKMTAITDPLETPSPPHTPTKLSPESRTSSMPGQDHIPLFKEDQDHFAAVAPTDTLVISEKEKVRPDTPTPVSPTHTEEVPGTSSRYKDSPSLPGVTKTIITSPVRVIPMEPSSLAATAEEEESSGNPAHSVSYSQAGSLTDDSLQLKYSPPLVEDSFGHARNDSFASSAGMISSFSQNSTSSGFNTTPSDSPLTTQKSLPVAEEHGEPDDQVNEDESGPSSSPMERTSSSNVWGQTPTPKPIFPFNIARSHHDSSTQGAGGDGSDTPRPSRILPRKQDASQHALDAEMMPPPPLTSKASSIEKTADDESSSEIPASPSSPSASTSEQKPKSAKKKQNRKKKGAQAQGGGAK